MYLQDYFDRCVVETNWTLENLLPPEETTPEDHSQGDAVQCFCGRKTLARDSLELVQSSGPVYIVRTDLPVLFEQAWNYKSYFLMAGINEQIASFVLYTSLSPIVKNTILLDLAGLRVKPRIWTGRRQKDFC